MCSYSGSDGGGNDGYNNNGGKPQKRQRLPKRGPGVAELEKILREQEKKNDQIEGFPSCFLPSLSSNDHHLNSRPSHEPNLPWTNLNNSSLLTTTRRVPFVSHLHHHHHHHQTSTTPPPQPTVVLPLPPNICGNSSSILRRPFGGGGSVGVNLPEHALFPVTWSTTTPSNSNTTGDEGKIYSDTGGNNICSLPTTDHPLWSSIQNKHYQNPTNSVTKQFPGYTSSSLSTPSSVGLNNQIEPPSSQRSYQNYPSMPQHQEEKVVGLKRRSQSFLADNPPGPILQSQVLHQLLQPHMHRPVDQPSHYNVELSKTMLPSTFIRDVAKSAHDPLELNLHNHDTQYGAPPPPPPPPHHHHQPNFMKFNPTTIHVPPSVLQTNSQEQQHYSSKYEAPSFQGNMEEYMYSHEGSEAAGSDFNKPLYSFLVSKEQMGTEENILSLDINNGSEPADGEDQGIDLNLKL